MANCGLPGTSGFVGEFMVIMSAMQNNFWIALIAASSLIFGAAYSLWMVKRVFYGEPRNQKLVHLKISHGVNSLSCLFWQCSSF